MFCGSQKASDSCFGATIKAQKALCLGHLRGHVYDGLTSLTEVGASYRPKALWHVLLTGSNDRGKIDASHRQVFIAA